MTEDELLDGLVEREGGYSENAADAGGATKYGITAAVLGNWRRLGRQATRAEVQSLTIEEAKEIYRQRYLPPFAWVPFEALRVQLVDFGVTSGTGTAMRMLQRVLGVAEDGIAGDRTKAALLSSSWRLVNASLVARRVAYDTAIVDRDPTQKVFHYGWTRRAVSFL